MICSKCNNSGILNHANNKPFYYCRTCKIEIGSESVSMSSQDRFIVAVKAQMENVIRKLYKNL